MRNVVGYKVDPSMGSEPVDSHYGSVSVPIAWATFEGSTCLLFLLCYLCQKKLQEQDSQSNINSPQVYVISSIPRTDHQSEDVSRQAPPDYEKAVLQNHGKKRSQIEEPPSYEAATASNKTFHASSLTM